MSQHSASHPSSFLCYCYCVPSQIVLIPFHQLKDSAVLHVLLEVYILAICMYILNVKIRKVKFLIWSLLYIFLLTCYTSISSTGPSMCPPDKPLVNCIVDPCMFAMCSNHPNAVCVADYCGGCNARFFIGKIEVTETCCKLSSS